MPEVTFEEYFHDIWAQATQMPKICRPSSRRCRSVSSISLNRESFTFSPTPLPLISAGSLSGQIAQAVIKSDENISPKIQVVVELTKKMQKKKLLVVVKIT